MTISRVLRLANRLSISSMISSRRGLEVRTCELQFIDYGRLARFSGSVRTVECFEDNAILKEVLASEGDGAVLVVDGAGSLRTTQ